MEISIGWGRFYYGWANVVLAALAMVATLPGRTQGLGLVTEPLLAELQIDRVTYATVNLWATLFGAVFCLPFGGWTDRFGPRIVTSSLAAALGVTTIVMSQTVTFPMICVTIALTRGLGQSALSVVSLALVGKWFSRRLNYAMGIYALLVGFGFIACFPSVGQAVLTQGWRAAWQGVGIGLLLFSVLAAVAIRDRPTGSQQEEVSEGAVLLPTDFTVRRALQTAAFWIFSLASAMFGLVYSGIALFNQSILEQRGFPAETYHNVLVVSTLLGLVANFGGGWLALRWPLQRLMGVGMGMLAASLTMLPLVVTSSHVMIYAATMGIAGGIVTVVFFSVWGQVFGRTHLGRIQGVAQMMTVLASAVGPLILATGLEKTRSYDSIFYLLAAVVLLLGLASWRVSLPD